MVHPAPLLGPDLSLRVPASANSPLVILMLTFFVGVLSFFLVFLASPPKKKHGDRRRPIPHPARGAASPPRLRLSWRSRRRPRLPPAPAVLLGPPPTRQHLPSPTPPHLMVSMFLYMFFLFVFFFVGFLGTPFFHGFCGSPSHPCSPFCCGVFLAPRFFGWWWVLSTPFFFCFLFCFFCS